MARPVIAVTGPSRGAFGPRALVALAVWMYGGRPVQVRPGQAWAELSHDGVVVTGGHDIDPVLYAAAPEVEPRYDPARDALEKQVITDALARHLPILGICRGAQMLNVCRGGSLVQNLRARRRNTSNRRTVLPLKTLRVVPGTLLSGLLGRETCKINSLHNQAIDRIGAGLTVCGRDLDGIVQAVEDPAHGFLLGVQWHPEFLIPMKAQRNLFKALVEHARRRLVRALPEGAGVL